MAVSSSANKPNLPWKTRFLTATLGYILDWCCRSDGTVHRCLLSLLELPKSRPSTIDGVTSRDITYDPSRHLWFRIYTPIGTGTGTGSGSRLPVVVYFHGGGFFCGSPDMAICDTHCRQLAANLPAVVVSVKYRRAPEHPIPAQFDDGMSVLRFLEDAVQDFGDINKCFLTGDSCGGNIAYHVAVRVAEEGGFGRVRIAGVVAVQPFLGGEERTESELRISAGGVNAKRIDIWWKVALPKGSNRDHEAANIFGPNSTMNIMSLNIPPIIIFIGGFDPLKDWQMRYYDGLKDAGKQVCLVEYPNAIHGFALFHELPESSQFITDLRDFIRQH